MSPICVSIKSIYVGIIGENLGSRNIWYVKLVKWVTSHNIKEQLKFSLGYHQSPKRPQDDPVDKAKLGFPRSRKGRKG